MLSLKAFQDSLMALLLLLSNSRAPGLEFIEHALDQLEELFGQRARLLFLAHASSEPDRYAKIMEEALAPLQTPVVRAIRAPTWLPSSVPQTRSSSEAAPLVGGVSSGRLFARGQSAVDLPPGSDVSDLLATQPRYDVSSHAEESS